MSNAVARKSFLSLLGDQLRFLRSLIVDPAKTGAVAPSGRALARLMASFVDPADPLPVLELGPGTGVVTGALIERGVAPEQILAVEFNPDFCRLLADRLPGVTVVRRRRLRPRFGTLRIGWRAVLGGGLEPAAAHPPEEVRVALIDAALGRMAPGRPFIQFSYSFFAPVKPVPGLFLCREVALGGRQPAAGAGLARTGGRSAGADAGLRRRPKEFARGFHQNSRLRRFDPHRLAFGASSPRSAAKELALADADVTHHLARRLPAADLRRRPREGQGRAGERPEARPPDRRPAGRLHRHAGIQSLAAAAPQEHDRLDQPPRSGAKRHQVPPQGLCHRRDVERPDRRRPGAHRSPQGRRRGLGGIVVPEKIEVSRAAGGLRRMPAISSPRRRPSCSRTLVQRSRRASPAGWRTSTPVA